MESTPPKVSHLQNTLFPLCFFITHCLFFILQKGPQDGPDPDGLSGGGNRVPHRVPQPRPGREPPPPSVLLKVHHLSAFPPSKSIVT